MLRLMETSRDVLSVRNVYLISNHLEQKGFLDKTVLEIRGKNLPCNIYRFKLNKLNF